MVKFEGPLSLGLRLPGWEIVVGDIYMLSDYSILIVFTAETLYRASSHALSKSISQGVQSVIVSHVACPCAPSDTPAT